MAKHELDVGQELEDIEGNIITDPEERFALLTECASGLMEALRHERNFKLQETDWWANSDVEMTEERRAYRQALRDITKGYKTPWDVVWPEKPE